jgi:hypothetical protein
MSLRLSHLLSLSFILPMGLVFPLLFLSQNAFAVDIGLIWGANGEPDIIGYRAFLREQGERYDYNRAEWEGSRTTCKIHGLDDETQYFFVVRAVDASGNESRNSREVGFPAAHTGACGGSAEASISVTHTSEKTSDITDHLAYFLLPVGAVIALRAWRRKK